LPSLRKTVHLVAPGWNVIGAGEPALPGVALGHNDEIAFGFTIVGIDQQDLFVEKLNPTNPDEYLYNGTYRKFDIEQQQIAVKGRATAQTVTLKYSIHGPILHEAKGYAYALKWVGLEPGGAGYLPALRLAQARNWKEFQDAARYYKVPSENLNYADRKGNIGWIASGLAPIRKSGATGLFPVPGDTDAYEWAGYLPLEKHPQAYNPAKHYVATANHNILPQGYQEQLSYEWAAPFRFQRVEEMLQEKRKFTVADFERMQYDIVSMPARRFQNILKQWRPARHNQLVAEMLQWDCRVTADSRQALLFEVWTSRLAAALYGREFAGRNVSLTVVFSDLEKTANSKALADALEAAVREIERLIPDANKRIWGTIHQLHLRHPLGALVKNGPELDLAAIPRPGDGNTVLAQSGVNFRTTNGASYRQVIDLSDWDKSTMTNVPGESGDPASKHYSDLLGDWANGRYHPMPFSRKAVEAALEERLMLTPASVR